MNELDRIIDANSMKEILEIAILRSEESLAFDMTAADKTAIDSAKALFLKMAEDEIKHRRALQRQLDDVLARIELSRAMAGDAY